MLPPAMISLTPCPPRMVVVTMACISAGILTPVQAQEVSPVVDDRVEASGEMVPAVPESEAPVDETGRGGLDIGVMLSSAYDSNIFLSKKKAVSDTVTRIGPDIAYTQGDSKEGEGGFCSR